MKRRPCWCGTSAKAISGWGRSSRCLCLGATKRSLKFASSSSLPTTKRALCAAKTAPTASSSAKTPTNAPSSSRRTLRWWSLHGAAGGVANAVTSSSKRSTCAPRSCPLSSTAARPTTWSWCWRELFFWEVVDLQAMYQRTWDTTGDVCNHARSKFIERVSKATLQEFMRDFNKIAETVHKEDDDFYRSRGVLIHSLEVSGYRCAESSTAQILQQIIQETTNRMNRLQQQESENEWQLLQIKGDIEEERAKKELLDVQIANSAARAQMEGEGEACKVKAFLQGLAHDLPDMETRVGLWNVLRKREALAEVCKEGSGARLYYTPNDVNLSIEDRSGPVCAVSTSSSACKI